MPSLLLRRTRRDAVHDRSGAQGPHRSLWLQEALGDAPAEPSLRGEARADVAIIGGGFVGLWTAIRIKEREPGCDVVLLEQDVCGGGASGRNGGMALSWWPKLASLAKICGAQDAVRLCRLSEEAITEIDRFCARHGIDARFRRDGMLWTATSPAQVGGWEAVVRSTEELGLRVFERVERDEVVARAGSETHLAGIREPSGACLQPALLARGLRRAALAAGVRIHERSRVISFAREQPVEIRTHGGVLRSDRLVVAMNAWAAALPELRRALIVVSSDIVATPPIPERLDALGWTGHDAITDSQMMVNYYRRTANGRVAFGKGTGELALGGRIGRRYDRADDRAAMTTAQFRRYYPSLADVPIDSYWGGAVDRTPNSVPILGHLGGREHIVYGVGWSGNGVAPSVIGGRVLAGLALGRDDEWTRLPLVDRRHEHFPPDPVRFVGGRLVREAVIRKEHAELRGRTPKRLAVRMAALAPAGLEDKE